MYLSEKEFKRLWKVKPIASSDVVVSRGKEILLVKRATKPFRGWWTLPGGMMDVGEKIEQTALREVLEETGAKVELKKIIGVYSGPDRDPRGTTACTAFLAKFLKFDGKHDHEVEEIKFFSINRLPRNIAFDHRTILKDALKLMGRNKRR